MPFRDDGFDRNRLLRDTTDGYDGSLLHRRQLHAELHIRTCNFPGCPGPTSPPSPYQFDFPLEISMDISAENVFFNKERRSRRSPKIAGTEKAQAFSCRASGLNTRPTPNTFLSIPVHQ